MRKLTAAKWLAILSAVLALIGVIIAALADRTITADEAQRISEEVTKVLQTVAEEAADTPAVMVPAE